MEFQKCFVASTAHLTEKTCNQHDDYPVVGRGEVGVFVSVPGEALSRTSGITIPPDLRALVAFAQKQGCHLIRLDPDAPIVPGLPTYSW